MAMVAPRLFEHDRPPGLQYRDDFIAEADERVLLDAIAEIAFPDFEMRGVVARRRVAFFGQSYDRNDPKREPSELPRYASRRPWTM